MAPRKKTTQKAEQGKNQEQLKKMDLFMADFDKQYISRLQDAKRHARNLCKQVESVYVQEIYKLPKAVREMKLNVFLETKGQPTTATLVQIEEEINKAIQLPPIKKPLATSKRLVHAALSVNPSPCPNISSGAQMLPQRQPFGATTVCRKAMPNEMLWSSQGSPVVVDPRTALGQSRIQAAISLNQGTIALTDSPVSDAEKCPNLSKSDIEAISKLQDKLSKLVEINKERADAETDKQTPACSSKNRFN